MRRLFSAMDDTDRLLPLHIGLDAGGGGSAFVARNLGRLDVAQQGFMVSTAEVEEGCLLQLHVRDAAWARRGFAQLVQVCCMVTARHFLQGCSRPVFLCMATLQTHVRCCMPAQQWQAMSRACHGLCMRRGRDTGVSC